MTILPKDQAETIRQLYIETFVDTEMDFYINNIQTLKEFSDGMRYTGYLWDCLKNAKSKSKFFCNDHLGRQGELYVFWDLHSKDRIFIENYWKYPIDSVLRMNYDELRKLENDLPEDIYIFDDTFEWSIAYTHEDDLKGNRLLYFTTGK